MNKYLVLLSFFFLMSCTDEQGKLELEILNNEIVSCKVNKSNSPTTNLNDYTNKSLNVIRYKLTNNSNTIYYFNKNYDKIFKMPGFLNGNMSERENIAFIDEEGHTAKVPFVCAYPSDSMFVYLKFRRIYEEKERKALGYSTRGLPPKHNCIIHPGETLYFESYMHLPDDKSESDNSHFVFDERKKYKMKIQVYSDSTNYKKTISKSDVATIKENHYVVFNGIITSKNEVPLRFIDCN